MLNDGTLHDEIMYKRTKLVIDTADLGEAYGRRYETMALFPNKFRDELECVRSETEEEARRVHSIMLDKHKRQAAELTGKYAKLRDDLLAAYAETVGEEETEDGGTCNFDSPVLHLPKWNADKVKQAVEEAGGHAFKWTERGRLFGWVISPNSSGQGNRRSRRAEAISEALKKRGYDTGMYYQMD